MNDLPDTAPGRRATAGAGVHQMARHAAVRAVAEVVGKLATLAWTVAAVRILSQDAFGAFSYAFSLMLLVSTFPSWGFDVGVAYRGSRHPDQLNALYSRTLVWKTLLGLPVLAGVAVVVGWYRPTGEATLVLALVLAAGLPEIYSLTSRSAATAMGSAVGISWALIVQRLAAAAAIALALLLGTGVVGVSVAFLAASLVGWAAHIRATRRLGVRFESDTITRTGLWTLLSQTLTVGFSAIVLVVLFRVDMVLLGFLAGDDAVAEYTVAFRLLETVLFVTFAIDQSVIPMMSAAGDGERARRGLEQALALAACLYLPFAVVALTEGDRIITTLFGDSYGGAPVTCLVWLAPAPLLFAACHLLSSLVTSRERYRPTLVAALVAAALNVGLNLYLIPRYGSVGAAAATTMSFAVQLVVLRVGVRMVGQRVSVLAPLPISGLAALVLGIFLVAIDLPLAVELALGGGVYLAGWLLLARRLAPVQADVALGFVRRRSGRR